MLQAVDRGALASRLHLVDLDTGRVSVLERPVAALRPVASLGDTLAWVEVLGQRSAHARFDALQALRPVPPPGAWGGTHADEGCTLVLRPRRACLEPSACELRLRPPWTRVDVPVSPLQPGDVEYHPPAALPVLVFGVSNRWRDPWAREQEPRHSGRLLTAEGHAIDEVAQGLIGSEDGRWLLFARRTVRDEVESHQDRRVTDWEIAQLDRAAHRLHVRRGEHFGGLPFFRAFEGDRIVFDTSPEPWWRPELPRASHTWSLEAVLERLDARPLVQGDGLWRLPDDRTPVARWQALQMAWQAGDWPA